MLVNARLSAQLEKDSADVFVYGVSLYPWEELICIHIANGIWSREVTFGRPEVRPRVPMTEGGWALVSHLSALIHPPDRPSNWGLIG